jgi:hypothetical protein
LCTQTKFIADGDKFSEITSLNMSEDPKQFDFCRSPLRL